MTFGIVRPSKRSRKRESLRETQSYKSLSQVLVYCEPCEKRGYRSEGTARQVIGRMLRCGALRGPKTFSFVPYQCPHGHWHTGHDPRSLRAFDEFFKKQRLKELAALHPELGSARPVAPRCSKAHTC